ncbi:MAG: phosphonate ABC transporter ATP-binding protein [Nitrospirae bacterium]|nr:phosphonate ABC transporter ATP-binding protein [Nitrospirota bacterium]
MLCVEGINKRFNGRQVLSNLNLRVGSGETVALIGSSGSGKTTLIRTINGFVVPDSGRVAIQGKDIDYRNREALRQTRKRIGMVYQLFNLVERASALDNVMSGALGRMDRGIHLLVSTVGFFQKEDRDKAMDVLRFVGIEDKANERVDRLSGGQKQRVAIARALMQEPELLLADEPVANLDPKTGRKILELFLKINVGKGITVITVLHHIEAVRDHFRRVAAIKDGTVCFDGKVDELTGDHIDYIYKSDRNLECAAA